MQLSTTCRQSPHCDLAAVAWALLHACHGCGAVWMGRLDCGALAGLRCACCYHLAMGNTVPMWQCCASFMNEVCPRTPLLQLCGGLLTHTWLVTKNLQAFYSKWRFKAHPNVISDQVPCRAEQLYFPRISTQAATCSKRHTHDWSSCIATSLWSALELPHSCNCCCCCCCCWKPRAAVQTSSCSHYMSSLYQTCTQAPTDAGISMVDTHRLLQQQTGTCPCDLGLLCSTRFSKHKRHGFDQEGVKWELVIIGLIEPRPWEHR
jgi:hypothetical protein